MALKRIAVFPERCIAAGNCYEIASSYFDQTPGDGTVMVIREELDTADEALVLRAVAACPVAAIEVLDEV
jgi:ferredoxin